MISTKKKTEHIPEAISEQNTHKQRQAGIFNTLLLINIPFEVFDVIFQLLIPLGTTQNIQTYKNTNKGQYPHN